MQLKLRVLKDWRSVVVTLIDGCWPSVDGCLLSELVPDPAVWFKVAVLRCVSIDCAQRVISWNFLSKESRQCCLMAPHEGNAPPSWMDELACIFELAETLFEASSTASVNIRLLKVKQRTWARLLESFILPLVNLLASDLPSLEEALSSQAVALANLDATISTIVAQTTEVKKQLAELRASFLPVVLDWAQAGKVSRLFLEHLIADIKKIENKTRSKIESFGLSQRYPQVTGTLDASTADCAVSEQLLMDMLSLRSQLVECLLSVDEEEKTMTEKPEQYLSLHKKLNSLRATGTTTSDRKVLALRVRECLQLVVSNGGADLVNHSKLRPQHHLSTSSYQTTSDKLNIVLSMPSTSVAVIHQQFCSEFRSTWFEEFVLVEGPFETTPSSLLNERLEGGIHRPLLLQSVKRHIDRMLDAIADHFGNHDADFAQRMQLAYEKVFFDMFHRDLMAMYSDSEKKAVECLQLNALGAAFLPTDPSLPPAITALFPPVGFEHIMQRYQEMKGNATPLPWQQACSQDYIDHFGGLIFDLECLLQVHSPLEKLQLLTSAFRKLMASVSALQDRVACCDDLLPVVVGTLLRINPKLLADIHINTIFLNDFIAPFLSSGWHGYSLTFFSSAIRLISEI